MMTFRQALENTSWRLLLVIGRQRQLRLSSRSRKAELVDYLAQALLDPENLAMALTALSPAHRAALADLLAAGGTVPLRYLRPEHGGLRPPQQVLGHYHPASQTEPELSPLERLRALGLIFFDKADAHIFIPAELEPLLASLRPEVVPPKPLPAPDMVRSPTDLLCHDLTCFLALLHRDEVQLRHRRWLPPRFLARWGDYCRVPPRLPTARSEPQTGCRRFLHYLAENAGPKMRAGSLPMIN